MKNSGLKNHFKLLVVFVALAAVSLSGCKKDDDNGDGGQYYMRFKANGTTVEFKVQASLVAAFGHAENVYNAVFTGYDADSNISLQVFDSKDIVETTYSGYGLVGTSFVGALIGYKDTGETLYTQGATASDASVTISEITATTVKGTFQGTLKADGKANIAVTNGEFFVWRAN